MADDDATQAEALASEAVTSEEGSQEKTFSQTDVDKIVTDRLARQAKKFGDYDDLKSFKAHAEEARKASMSETEQAIEAARTEAANGIRLEYASQLAAASIKAELTGLVDNPEDVVEDLNMKKFVNEDHSVNTEAVSALRAKYEQLLTNKRKPALNHFDHGRANDKQSSGSVQEEFAAFINQNK